MRVLIDKYIPFLQGIVDRFAEVLYLEPEDFTSAVVHDSDALIIRTRTTCNAALLAGSRVQFIATATIGTDHIDLNYCRTHNISVVSCPGCNAKAVCEYVMEAVREIDYSRPISLGIVGAGHVGGKLAKMAMDNNFHVVINDPPRHLNGDVTACDIITFHTPLTHDGDHPTYHLCDAKFLSCCKPGALIINAARGGVVDEHALLASGHPFIIDTWEDEPNINPEVLNRSLLASMHIAGYSILGKRNASQMSLDALCKHFALPALSLADEQLPQGDNAPGWLRRISDQLKAAPGQFEQLRKNYKLR